MEFNDMLHGWTVRGDLADPLIKRSVSGSIISWVVEFNDMLHGWTVRGDLADPLIKRLVSGNVADPDPGSRAFLTPGSGIRDG